MTALDVLQQLHDLGVLSTPLPDRSVRSRAPKGVLTRAMLATMRLFSWALAATTMALDKASPLPVLMSEMEAQMREAHLMAKARLRIIYAHGRRTSPFDQSDH